MRNRVFFALGIASLLIVSAAQAAIVREWDSTKNRWITYDTKSPIYFQGSGKSAVEREFVSYTGPYGPKTIVINTGERRLYFIYEPGKAIKYGIGVGREGFTWSGTDVVSNKAEWPGWTPPPEMIQREKAKGRILPAHMAGGLNNPLGARALYIGSRIYRIHGSNEPWTIGHAVSSGCIRMTNDDVVDLYNRVPVGTRVVVLPEGASAMVADTAAPSDKPLVPPNPVGPKKALVKAPLPVKAPAKAVIAVNVPAEDPMPAKKAKPVIVAKKAPAAAPVADQAVAALPARPTKDDMETASIAPAPAQPKVVVIIPKMSADSTAGGGNVGEISATVTIPVASSAPVTGDRLVGSANN